MILYFTQKEDRRRYMSGPLNNWWFGSGYRNGGGGGGKGRSSTYGSDGSGDYGLPLSHNNNAAAETNGENLGKLFLKNWHFGEQKSGIKHPLHNAKYFDLPAR